LLLHKYADRIRCRICNAPGRIPKSKNPQGGKEYTDPNPGTPLLKAGYRTPINAHTLGEFGLSPTPTRPRYTYALAIGKQPVRHFARIITMIHNITLKIINILYIRQYDKSQRLYNAPLRAEFDVPSWPSIASRSAPDPTAYAAEVTPHPPLDIDHSLLDIGYSRIPYRLHGLPGGLRPTCICIKFRQPPHV